MGRISEKEEDLCEGRVDVSLREVEQLQATRNRVKAESYLRFGTASLVGGYSRGNSSLSYCEGLSVGLKRQPCVTAGYAETV